jgi:hypothetical protein
MASFFCRYQLIIILLFASVAALAQQRQQHTNMLWFNYNNYIPINKKWALNNDVQLRTRNWAGLWNQHALRTGLQYNINGQFSVQAGMAWFGTMRSSAGKWIMANEWRPWQEIAWQHRRPKTTFIQRVRQEQRWLQQVKDGKRTPSYDFRFRLRYRLEWGMHNQKQNLAFFVGNELMIHPFFAGRSDFFEQNRTFAYVNYQVNKKLTLQWQVIKIFQWRPATQLMENQDVLRFSLHHRFLK